MATLREELTHLLNSHCRENYSNTPDFILAEYLLAVLSAYEAAVNSRDAWYGIKVKLAQKNYKVKDILDALEEEK